MKKINSEVSVVSKNPPVVEKAKKPTLSSRFRELILEGLDNKTCTERVKAEFPEFGGKKTHDRYAAWYRSKMKSESEESDAE